MNLKESTERLARWMLRRVGYDFKFVHRRGKYYEAAGAMSRPAQKSTDKAQGSANVDRDIPAYRTVGQISEPDTIPEENEDKVGPLHTSEELMGAQANDVVCQNLREVLREDETIIVNEDGLLYKKVPTDGAVQINVSERYTKTLLILGTAKY